MILVFDLSTMNEATIYQELSKWARDYLRIFEEDGEIFVVGTKLDLITDASILKNFRRNIQDWCFIHNSAEYFEVSSNDGTNVDVLVNALENAMYEKTVACSKQNRIQQVACGIRMDNTPPPSSCLC